MYETGFAGNKLKKVSYPSKVHMNLTQNRGKKDLLKNGLINFFRWALIIVIESSIVGINRHDYNAVF